MKIELKVLGTARGARESNGVYTVKEDGVYMITGAQNQGIVIKYAHLFSEKEEYLSKSLHRIKKDHIKIIVAGKYIAIYAVGGPIVYSLDTQIYPLAINHAIDPIPNKDYILILPCDNQPPVEIWLKQS